MADNGVEVNNYSGGILEALSPEDFSGRNWAALQGFVLESEVSIRSQWAIQEVGRNWRGADDDYNDTHRVASNTGYVDEYLAGEDGDLVFEAIRTFRGKTADYLVAKTTSGYIYYTILPDRSASQASIAKRTWTLLSYSTPLSAGGYRSNQDGQTYFCADVPVPFDYSGTDIEANYATLLMNSLSSESGSAVFADDNLISGGQTVLEYGKVGGASVPVSSGPSKALLHTTVFSSSNSRYPVSHLGSGDQATTIVLEKNKLPRSQLGVMWRDYLVLGSTQWKAQRLLGFSGSNKLFYHNGLWISGNPLKYGIDSWDPDTGFFTIGIHQSARIVDFQVIDQGLLVFTTTAGPNSGVYLLRGQPPLKYTVEVLVSGTGLASPTREGHHSYVTYWAEPGLTCWVDETGAIMSTDGSQVRRLDMTGPAQVTSADQYAQCESISSYLFVARNGRLLCLKSFGQDAAWTDIVTPHPGETITHMQAHEDSLYFVQAGRVYRLAMSAEAERGLVCGLPVDLTCSSPTVQFSSDDFTKTRWFRVGMRMSSSTNGFLKSVSVRGAAALLTAEDIAAQPVPQVDYAINTPIEPRGQITVPGFGSSIEVSATIKLTGDVRLEGITFYQLGKKRSREQS